MKLASIASFSAYKRADAHLTRQTAHGAVVTILGLLLGLTLASHEIYWYLSGQGNSKMMVDAARRHDLQIHVDVSFPAIPCAGLSVDVMDASGSTGNDVSKVKDVDLHKIRLDGHGKRVGGRDGEYVTPQSQKIVRDRLGTVMQIDLGAAMTQMSDMDTELQKHEGCRIHGDFQVRRVAGKVHFAVHQQSFVDVLPQMLTGHVLPKLTNMSHVIHKVAFGPEYPGQVNPLDGFKRILQPGESPKAFKYYLKIVPTDYRSRMGLVLETNQYSVSEYAMPLMNGDSQPGSGGDSHATSSVRDAFIDFSYDLSPIIMSINQSPASLLHFVVRLCAVVGGVLSVTRMADKLVHALLVATGVVARPVSIKGRNSSGSYGGSARSSYGGDGTAYVSGSTRQYSYPGPPVPGIPDRAGSGPIGADGNLHQRLHGSYPGSHPLSRMTSNGSSMQGAPGFPPASHSLGGVSTGGMSPVFSMGSGPIGYGSSGGSSTAGTMMRPLGPGSLAGAGPVAGGVDGVPGGLHSAGSVGIAMGSGLAANSPASHILTGYGSAPVSHGGAYSPSSTPTAQQAAMMNNSVGSSRLSTASGLLHSLGGAPPLAGKSGHQM